MKFAANFILTIIFIVVSLLALLAGAVKFQLLDFHFWQNTFEKNNVYQNLSTATKSSLESQVSSEGGSKTDAKVLTDLITQENIKDFVDKNIENILTFANGKSPQITVYLPIEKIPKSILPKNLAGIKSEMPLQELLMKFNYQNYQNLALNNISHAADWATTVFIGSLSVLGLVLIFMILLTGKGTNFIAPGVAILLVGLLTLTLAKVGDGFRAIPHNDLPTSTSFTYIIAGNVLPAILKEVLHTWFIVGGVLTVLGLGLFFVKKPSYNQEK